MVIDLIDETSHDIRAYMTVLKTKCFLEGSIALQQSLNKTRTEVK